jgi:hypothetical protein
MRPGQFGDFFCRRWRGQVSFPVLFWRDVLGVGTLVNLSATLAALMLAAQGVRVELAAALHFAPLPYNLFLFAALLRAPQRTPFSTGLGMIWLAVMTVA